MIRPAEERDYPGIVELCHLVYRGRGSIAFLEKAGAPVDDVRFVQWLRDLVAGGYGLVIVSDDDGGLSGYLCGALLPWNLNPSVMLFSIFHWARNPEKRARGVGKSLLNIAEAWARLHGAKFVTAGAMDSEGAVNMAPLYGVYGFKPFERSFIKEV